MYPPGVNKGSKLGTYYDGTILSIVLHSFEGINVSESHRFKNGKPLSGGPWRMGKREYIYNIGKPMEVYVNNSDLHYTGGFKVTADYCYPVAPPSDWLTDSKLQANQADLALRGAEAFARCRPDLPDFSLATELLELRDIPGFLKTQILRIRRLARKEFNKRYPDGRRMSKFAQYHLELQFGWLPILSSVFAFKETLDKKDKLLRQRIRDAGRPIRRRRELSEPAERNQTYRNRQSFANGWGPEHSPILNTNCYIGPSWKQGICTVSWKTWAVAKMRYFLPPGPRNLRWKKRLWRRMMGGMVTTDLIYNAMPWTWLGDYFTDLGHFVRATSSGVGDRLAAEYCYLMRTITYEYESIACLGLRKKGGGRQETIISRKLVSTRKLRIEASPFGFGFRQSDLNPMQLTILGALGLSKI